VKRRTDIPAGELPGSSWSAIALEYLARLCAVAAVALLALVVVAIHHGRETKLAGQATTAAFRALNGYFDDRANFAAPARARQQLQTLNAILSDLDTTSAGDVDLLASTLPDVQRLKLAGQGDVAIAQQLVPVAKSLRDSLPHVVQTANSLVKACTTLGTLGDQLVTLASVLDSADPPLDSVVTATRDTNTAAAQAQPPVDHIAATLDRANANARDLGPKLDESLTRARTIESKLRVLLLLPSAPDDPRGDPMTRLLARKPLRPTPDRNRDRRRRLSGCSPAPFSVASLSSGELAATTALDRHCRPGRGVEGLPRRRRRGLVRLGRGVR
jgi:hypothetical protein